MGQYGAAFVARAPQQDPLPTGHYKWQNGHPRWVDPYYNMQLNLLPSLLPNLELVIFKRLNCGVKRLVREYGTAGVQTCD